VGGHPFAAAITVLLAPMAPPSAEPIDVVAVDTSALPSVAVDIVAPVRFSAEPITADAVDIDGAPVESVTPIDPDDVVVALVIDDRPDVDPAAVTSSQGAAVELVRNSRDGIEVSLGTPSGLRTALTSDRSATLARIAGITAGSPAVVPLTDVVTDTVAELAASEATDRYAVVVLGGAVDSADPALAGITDALTASGTVLHVVAPATTGAGALRRVAERSGGEVSTSPEVLAAVDEVTTVISNRYRVVATVAGAGPHHIGLALDGQRFSADFDVPTAAGPAHPSAPPATTPAQGRETPGSTPGSTPASTSRTNVEQAASPQQPDIADPAEGGGLPTRSIMLGALAIVLVVLVGAGVVIGSSVRGDDEEPYVIKKPADVPASPKPVPTPRPGAKPVPTTKAVPRPATKAVPKPVPTTKAVTKPPQRPKPGTGDISTRRRPAAVTPLPQRPPRSTPTPSAVEPPRPPEPPAPPPAGEPTEWIAAGDLRVSRALGEAWCGDRKVDLTPAELRVLELLITSGDRGVTREALAEAGELDDDGVGPNAVEAVLTQVRRKTGIRGRGHAVRKERVVTYFLE
jgi:hypothetical protein